MPVCGGPVWRSITKHPWRSTWSLRRLLLPLATRLTASPALVLLRIPAPLLPLALGMLILERPAECARNVVAAPMRI
jgi:hypothetical protein